MVTNALLNRKLGRDIWRSRWQAASVVILVFLGVAMFIGTYGSYLNLANSFRYTYTELKMADYWLSLNPVSQRAVNEIRSIPGVTAEGRIVQDIQMVIPEHGLDNVAVRVISLPGDRRADVNDVEIAEGGYFSADNTREVLLLSTFAEHHDFDAGDWVIVKIASREVRFRVAGVVDSPEYLQVSKSPQEPLPSPHNFGVVFLPAGSAERFFDMQDMVNEIVLELDGEADGKVALDEVRSILKDHGVGRIELQAEPASMAVKRKDVIRGLSTAWLTELGDLPGHRMLSMSLEFFAEIALIFPFFFLFLSAVTTYVLLARLTASQRPQIGVLKAIGYSSNQVLGHYLAYGSIMGVAGAILGALAGWYLQGVLTLQFARQIQLPLVSPGTNLPLLAISVLTGIAITIIASFVSARRTANMHPAESMRPPTSSGSQRPVMERLVPIPGWLPMMIKYPVRNILRSPYRSLFTVAGMVAAVSLILTMLIFLNSVQMALDMFYNKIQGYDVKAVARSLGPANLSIETESWAGVESTEAILEVPYRFQFGDKSEDGLLVGLPTGHSLYNLYSSEGQPVMVESNRLVLTKLLEKQLIVEAGDVVQLQPIFGAVGDAEVRVSSFVDLAHGGAMGFLPLKQVQQMLEAPGSANGLLLDLKGEPNPRVMDKLDNLPGFDAIAFKAADKEVCLGDHMAFLFAFIFVMLLFGTILGGTIVFSSVTVSIQERVRELSTLRTIGMSFWRLSSLITIENLILGGIGIAFGLLAGKWLSPVLVNIAQTEEFYLLPVFSTQSYGITVFAMLVVLLISQIPSLRYVGHLNLASATKDWTA